MPANTEHVWRVFAFMRVVLLGGSTPFARSNIISDITKEAKTTSMLIRGLAPETKELLAARAKKHGRSMEAEAREILNDAVSRKNIGLAFYDIGQNLAGDVELEIPARRGQARLAAFEGTGIQLVNPWDAT